MVYRRHCAVHINILALSCVELHVCIFSTSVHMHTRYIYFRCAGMHCITFIIIILITDYSKDQ